MRSDVTCVVLAGGQGTRIRALHPDVPKPMVKVAGEPFLHWLTLNIAAAGVRDFVYSVGYMGEQIEAWAQDGRYAALKRSVAWERTPLGTGGGLLNCLDACGSWVLVVNGDSLCLGGLDNLLAHAGDDALSGALIGVRQDDTSRYGSLVFDAESRELIAFREKAPGRGFINAGVYLFRTDVLGALGLTGPCSIERDIFPKLINKGHRLLVEPVLDAEFIDIGTPETVADASRFVEAHAAYFPKPG